MNHKQFKQQKSIIDTWCAEVQKAYNIENIDDVTDNHIVTYLAQKQLGFHSSIDDTHKKTIIKTWEDGFNGVFGTAENYYITKYENK